MSWIQMLGKTYDLCAYLAGQEIDDGPVLLPIAHSTANAQIEITVDLDGNFIRELTNIVDKNGRNEITVIPVTEDSASRGAGNFPHGLCDKLCYTAGDFSKYTGEEKEAYFTKYLDGLRGWADSDYSNPWILAVYRYVEKTVLIGDLVQAGLLMTDEAGLLSEKENKIHQLSQRDAFIRFAVYDGEKKRELWREQELYRLYAEYYTKHLTAEKSLCYASGKEEVCTEKHPSKVRNAGDKAKLISGNDESGFTFKGRFESKGEAAAVSYELSQKAHNALRWLLQKQGYQKDGCSILVFKLPSERKQDTPVEEMLFTPNICLDSIHAFAEMLDAQDFSEEPEKEEKNSSYGEEVRQNGDSLPAENRFAETDLGELFARRLELAMKGCASKFEADDTVVMIALDAATPGRLAITYYHEFAGNEFIERIIRWHRNCTWKRFVKYGETGKYIRVFNAPSLREIALAAYGTERGNGYLDCDARLIKSVVERLLPCVTGLSSKIPRDIVRAAVNRAGMPEAYSPFIWENQVAAAACAMIQYNSYEGKVDFMELQNDRDILFGRLLAVLDEMEQVAAYNSAEKKQETRLTNAKKYWNIYTRQPAKTFQQLYEKMITGYAAKLKTRNLKNYEDEIGEIMGKLGELGQFNNNALKENYLLGYFAQMDKMKAAKKNEGGEK